MTVKLKYIVWAAILIGAVYIFCHIRISNTPVRATLVDKFITWDKFGDPQYHMAYNREDGYSQVYEVSVGEYYGGTIGSHYLLTDQTIIWK